MIDAPYTGDNCMNIDITDRSQAARFGGPT